MKSRKVDEVSLKKIGWGQVPGGDPETLGSRRVRRDDQTLCCGWRGRTLGSSRFYRIILFYYFIFVLQKVIA